MKRTFTIMLYTVLILAALFAETKTGNSSFRVSAYKNSELPKLDYKITISNYASSSITGFTNEYDVSSKLTSNNLSFQKALVVTIQSNMKLDIPVLISFSPFISQKDSSKTVPVKYTFTKDTPQAVEAQEWIWCNGSREYFRYTPELTLTDSSGSTVTSISTGSSGATATLTHSVPKAEIKRTGLFSYWDDYGGMPNAPGDTLPGFRGEQALTSTGYFKLSIDSDDYNNMAANVDYEATISLTITTV